MSDKEPCARCKAPTPTYDFEQDSTVWAFMQSETTTTITRRVRVGGHYWRRNPKHGSEHLVSDEKMPLCADCSYLLVGRFLQGRDVPAITREETKP